MNTSQWIVIKKPFAGGERSWGAIWSALRLLLGAALLLGCTTVNPSHDWPQWQGQSRDAVSAETGLLQEWPEAGPPLAWRVDGLGGGDSTPSIADGVIYGMSHRGEDEVVWAISENDGSSIWVSRVDSAYSQSWPQSKEGPGSTPTIDGDRLYAIGLAGNLVCLSRDDGKIIWQRSFQEDFDAEIPIWSFRESPLIDGEKLICSPGGSENTIVALDKITGETLWKCGIADSEKAAYSSAIAIDFDGQRQYVVFIDKAVVGVAAENGELLWRYDKPANQYGINISTPIYRDGHIFAASAYDNGGGLVKLVKQADGSISAEEVFFSKKMQNHHGGMLVIDGYLYGANGGNSGGYLLCLDFATGEVKWDDRRTGRKAPKGSVALADGRIYYRIETEGTLLLIEPSPDKMIERGRFEQPDRSGKMAWAHPVIANGKLYIRDHDLLLCYDISAKS